MHCLPSVPAAHQATASSRLLQRLSTLRITRLRFTLRPGHHPLASHRGQGARFLELREAWGLYVGLMGRHCGQATPLVSSPRLFLELMSTMVTCLVLSLPLDVCFWPSLRVPPSPRLPSGPASCGGDGLSHGLLSHVAGCRSLQGRYSRGCLPRLPSRFTLPCAWCHPSMALSE